MVPVSVDDWPRPIVTFDWLKVGAAAYATPDVMSAPTIASPATTPSNDNFFGYN